MLHFKYVACCFAFLPLLLHGVTAGAARQEQPSWHNINNSTAYEMRLHFKTPPAGWANHVIYGMQSMTADIVNRDLDSIKAKGFKALILEPGYNMPYPYLSEGYFKMVKSVVAAARKRGLKVWIIDEGKYPSGFAGGKFTRERPDLRMQAVVSCETFRVHPGEVITARAVDTAAVSAVAVSKSGRPNINIPITNHTISFSAGTDEWTVTVAAHAFRTGQTRSVDSPTGAKDTRNSQMDYLNPDAVRQFLNWTHEQYKKYIGQEFGKTVMGFRGDEPDYSHIPWTPAIAEEFRRQKGYDVTPYLASFLAPVMTDAERRAKADYWDVWSELFSRNFFRQEAEWCEKNGMAYITHLNNDHDMPACVRSEGNLFRDLSGVTVPGIDAIWNQIWPDTVNDFPKYASSVAHVWGHTRAFSESFAAYYNSPTIPEAKYVVDYQMARGINFFEYMFWLSGSKDKNWMSAPGMKGLNDYSNRMVWLLAQGRPGARIAVYYPVSTLWLGNTSVAGRVKRVTHELLEHHADFDFITDDAFSGALTLKGARLVNRSGQDYSTVIIPSADAVSATADSVLRAFAARGGQIIMWGSQPYSVYDRTFTAPKPFTAYAGSVSEWTDDATQAVTRSLGRREVMVRNLLPFEKRVRRKAGEPRPKPVDGTIDIRYQHRVLKDADMYFIFNEGRRQQKFSFGMDCTGRCEQWNAADGSVTPVAAHTDNGYTWADIDLQPWGTTVICVRRAGGRYDITHFGAVGDSSAVNTKAIQAAIDSCAADGGGEVVVPKGKFLTGAVFFRPGVNLHIEKDGSIISTVNDDDFPGVPTRFEGIERVWKPALVNFTGCHGAVISGEGTINGNGVAWKEYSKDKDFFVSMGRPRLLCLTGCNGITVNGIRLRDQASWGLHVLYCDNVVIDGVDIKAEHTIPSSDGIDIDSSTGVRIENCRIEDNDDCISLKSGKDAEGRSIARPTADVYVGNCTFGYGHSGVDIGSEVSGGISDITVENCRMEQGNSGAIRIKSQPSRGGVIENVVFRDIVLDGSETFVDVNMKWRMKGPQQPDAPQLTQLKNVVVENVSGTCRRYGRLTGYEKGKAPDGITFRNCNVKYTDGNNK